MKSLLTLERTMLFRDLRAVAPRYRVPDVKVTVRIPNLQHGIKPGNIAQAEAPKIAAACQKKIDTLRFNHLAAWYKLSLVNTEDKVLPQVDGMALG